MAFKYEQPILGAISTLIKNFQKVVFTDSARHTTLEHHRTLNTSAVQRQNGAGNEEKNFNLPDELSKSFL